MRPVRVEVITYTPTFFFHCQHCEITFREMGVGTAMRRDQARDGGEAVRVIRSFVPYIHTTCNQGAPKARG